MRLKLHLLSTFVFILFAKVALPEMRESVTQWGITWTFDKEYECGQFVNGDWWVVGPVKVVSVNPGPREAIPEEVNDLGNNHWGDSSLKNDQSKRNGSMVVLTPGSSQGYDSRGTTYKSNLSISFPYNLAVNRSLISSISNDTIPNKVVFQDIMWSSEKDLKSVMNTAAVLTCLDVAPPADAFRPSYIGTEKKIFRFSDIKWDKLMNLPAPATMPKWEQFEKYTERVWIDHLNGAWQGQWLLPTRNNQPSYGREYARIVSMASLMLHTDASQAQKEKLLIGLIQIGIDFRGIAEVGGKWNAGGGHTSGRKFPIIFAGLMFDDDWFFDMPESVLFHEDTQTYYGEGWAGQTALWQMIVHHGDRQPYMHIHPSRWETYDEGWAKTSESYRRCCNAQAWAGQTLTTLLMGGKRVWNHDAYFDYVDDWMRPEDIYAANRDGYARPSEEGTNYPPYDKFVTDMWSLYRSEVPEQANGTDNLMWDSEEDEWDNNPPPSAVSNPAFSPEQGTYTGAQIVTLSCPTPGAIIYYTLDGSEPDNSSLKYSAPILVDKTTLVKAIAVKPGLKSSEVESVSFEIQEDSAPPMIESVPISLEADKIVVIFNEPLDAESAKNTANYVIQDVSIASISLSDDLKSVTLNYEAVTPDVYSLTINNVKDVSGNSIEAGTKVDFIYMEGATSNTTFQTFEGSMQTGKFFVEFDAVPNDDKMDGVIGVLTGEAGEFADLACIIRFNTNGFIDARDGGKYTSDNSLPYSAGKLYHFKLEIDVKEGEYSIYVTPQGEEEKLLGIDYAFRTEQSGVSSLENWAFSALSGTHMVGNMSFYTPTSTSLQADNPLFKLSIYPNPCFTDFFVVNIDGKDNQSKYVISVYDITGQLIYTVETHAGICKIPVAGSGLHGSNMYFITITDGDYSMQRKLIVK